MPSQNLTQTLKRNEKTGKPILELIPLEKTAVHTPTQEEYWGLMRVYECSGWKWNGELLPTQFNAFPNFNEETYVGGGVDSSNNILGYETKEFYNKLGWKIISTSEFYKIEKVTPEIRQEINNWFERNKK